MTHAVGLFVALAAFWAVLSGQFTEPFLVGSGLVTVLVVTAVTARLGLVVFDEWPARSILSAALFYLPWVLWQAVVANVHLVRRVWSPRLRISPQMVRVPFRLRTSLGRATLANSITFTPGTVSVIVEHDAILVHALTDADAAGVLDGSMERRIAGLERSA